MRVLCAYVVRNNDCPLPCPLDALFFVGMRRDFELARNSELAVFCGFCGISGISENSGFPAEWVPCRCDDVSPKSQRVEPRSRAFSPISMRGDPMSQRVGARSRMFGRCAEVIHVMGELGQRRGVGFGRSCSLSIAGGRPEAVQRRELGSPTWPEFHQHHSILANFFSIC